LDQATSNPAPRTFKLVLAYDGTNYAGWQLQPDRPTLQSVFEGALEQIAGQAIRVTASGRTDAGVHAQGQVVSFSCVTRHSAEVLLRALNAHLPEDVVVRSAAEMPAGFHATYHAIRKRYRYTLVDGQLRDPFARRYAWQVGFALDDGAMHRAAQPLVGTHDFRSFETNWPNRATSIRTVYELSVSRHVGPGAPQIQVEVEADGFLYNMVRTIVGTLVEVGRRQRPESWPADVLGALDRRAAGMTAPALGLTLMHVEYADPSRPLAVEPSPDADLE
jgi:tRNA pseudouridine38-40 synthase